MRSALVYRAKKRLPNRFDLTRQATLFARKLHKPNTCMAKTINQALERIAAPEEKGEN